MTEINTTEIAKNNSTLEDTILKIGHAVTLLYPGTWILEAARFAKKNPSDKLMYYTSALIVEAFKAEMYVIAFSYLDYLSK